jgi:hypothetical protein
MKGSPFRFVLVAFALMTGASLAGPAAVARETQSPPPTIEVLQEGKAPRAQLRLSPPAGSSENVAMTVRQSIRQSGVSSASVNVPPIRANIAATLLDTTPSGDFHISFSYPSFDVLKGNGSNATTRQAVESALEGLQGLSGEMTLTAQGAVVDSSLAIPPDVDQSVGNVLDQLRDQLRSTTVPLPEPAVGTGARWRVTTELSLAGIQARQVYEYTLKKRDGSRLVLDLRGTQTAEPQSVELPGQQAGIDVRVTRYKTTFRGTVVFDLSKLLAVSGRIKGDGDQEFRVDAGGQHGTLRQRVGLDVTMKPA